MNLQLDSELRRLVDGMLENTLSRSEAARLEERMEADPSAMDYFLRNAIRSKALADRPVTRWPLGRALTSRGH